MILILMKILKKVKEEMSVLSEIQSKGVILRSREKEIEEGEKCTRYFFKKVISRGGAITVLKSRGREVCTTEDILKETESF